jgi:hypothetical protein
VAERLGRPVTNSTAYGRRIRDSGLEDVVERHFYWPLNVWPPGKEERLIGTWACSSVVVEYGPVWLQSALTVLRFNLFLPTVHTHSIVLGHENSVCPKCLF